MKYKLIKQIDKQIIGKNDWKIERVNYEGDKLLNYLKTILSDVMEDILDPDIAGKSPDKFIDNLVSGRFGDFSKKYIIAAINKDNNDVGLLIGLPEENSTLHIYSMGVSKPYRRKGVSTALINRCIMDMYHRNVKKMVLDVHKNNRPAMRLYNKMGFHMK